MPAVRAHCAGGGNPQAWSRRQLQPGRGHFPCITQPCASRARDSRVGGWGAVGSKAPHFRVGRCESVGGGEEGVMCARANRG
eukprot:3065967-Pyramimonas_sp.AAC.2